MTTESGPLPRAAALTAQRSEYAASSTARKRTSMAGERLVLVFHFGLGQGRPAIRAPVHRLETVVDVAVFDDPAESAQDVGLECEVHSQIRMVPVPEDREALEVLALPLHLGRRVFPAGMAEAGRVHLNPCFPELLLHFKLDRQAVAVPARNERGVVAAQQPGFDDDVLQRLVDSVPDMDLAVGVWRAVVQDEARPATAHIPYLAVQPRRFPHGGSLRLARGQVGLHGKGSLRQVQSVLVIGHGQGDGACGVEGRSNGRRAALNKRCRRRRVPRERRTRSARVALRTSRSAFPRAACA